MPKETALATFLRDRGIEPSTDRAKNMELARPYFKSYKQYREEFEQKQLENNK